MFAERKIIVLNRTDKIADYSLIPMAREGLVLG
jgi:hypothetical protein